MNRHIAEDATGSLKVVAWCWSWITADDDQLLEVANLTLLYTSIDGSKRRIEATVKTEHYFRCVVANLFLASTNRINI